MSEVVRVEPWKTVKLGEVSGNLLMGEGSTAEGEGVPPRIRVRGTVRCTGYCTFIGTLEAGKFYARGGDITVEGDLIVETEIRIDRGKLTVRGDVKAKTIDVDKKVVVSKNLEAEEVKVGGSLEVEGRVEAELVDVGGFFAAGGEVKVKKVEVGGSFRAEGNVEIEELDVGGKAAVAG
ncbi:MAG: hypothetical protein DRO05_07950 [Thermoproteota archaeon]|nr:MAG: hypothetical protein DRO05_07950 [Candidatus Korarchaeota archaeon]